MKTDHSPGPWEHRNNLGDNWVVDANGETVANASAVYPECVITLTEPNARLIAAAPEMREALVELLANLVDDKAEELMGHMALHPVTRAEMHYSKWISLIEKATGKTWEELND